MQIIERVQLTFYGNNNQNYGEDVSIVCWLELEAMQTNKISIDRSTGQKLSLLRCEILMEVQSDGWLMPVTLTEQISGEPIWKLIFQLLLLPMMIMTWKIKT